MLTVLKPEPPPPETAKPKLPPPPPRRLSVARASAAPRPSSLRVPEPSPAEAWSEVRLLLAAPGIGPTPLPLPPRRPQRFTLDGVPYYYNISTEELSWEKPDCLKSAAERETERGDWCWVRDPVRGWAPGRLVSAEADGSHTCRTDEVRAAWWWWRGGA